MVADEEAVVLVLLHRSERDHRSWELAHAARRRLPHRFHEVELQALDGAASRELAAGAAAGAELPDALAALIAERAGGNPFFLEEALADLVERGALAERDGQLDLAVPSAVQEALQARLDRLDAATREVVNVAAVIGQSFGLQLLERVAPTRGSAARCPSCSGSISSSRSGAPVPEYRFRHGLVQEVAYRSLLEPRRRLCTARSAARSRSSIGIRSARSTGCSPGTSAESDEPAVAVDYLLMAGDAARALFANEEAREFYRQAIELLAEDDSRARATLLKLGLSHYLAFEFEQAAAMYRLAFSLPAPIPVRSEPSARIEVLISTIGDYTPGTYQTGDVWLAAQLFRGLVTLDPEMNVVPDLAEEFSLSDDGLTYRFRIRADASWSDGVPVTAEDFAYTLRRMRDEKVASSVLLGPIKTAVAEDRLTLDIHMRAASNLFLYVLAMPPAFAWPKHSCETLGDAWRDPANLVSSGPFMLGELDEKHATLRARDDWPGTRGNVAEASFSQFPLGVSWLGSWRSGRGDMASTNTETIPPGDDTVVAAGAAMGTWYLGFRADCPPFDDERVRRAFALASRHGADRGGVDRAKPAGRAGRIPAARDPGALPSDRPTVRPDAGARVARRGRPCRRPGVAGAHLRDRRRRPRDPHVRAAVRRRLGGTRRQGRRRGLRAAANGRGHQPLALVDLGLVSGFPGSSRSAGISFIADSPLRGFAELDGLVRACPRAPPPG